MAFQTLGFKCAFTVEVDPEFPGDGDWGCPVAAFDRTGSVMPAFESRWGTPLVARVQPHSGQDWVAMFAAGGLGSLRGVFATPSPRLVAVVVDGLAYLVDSRSPGLPAEIVQDQVHQVEPCHDPPLVLLAGFLDLVAIGPGGIAWKTPRLCVDGLEVHHAGRTGIECSCDDDGKRPITLDPATGKQIDGTRLGLQ